MKRFIKSVILVTMAMMLVACSNKTNTNNVNSEEKKEVTKETMPVTSLESKDENFRYETVEGGISICEYMEDDDKIDILNIPEYLDGERVVGISARAFWGWEEGPTTVNLPDSILQIGEEAFTQCTNLETINFGNSLQTIGKQAFLNCSNLNNIVIPSTVTEIGLGAFSNCVGLNNVVCNANLKKMEPTVFCMSGIVNFVVPDSVSEIGSGTFASCDYLEEIVIGSSVASIDESAFQESPNVVIKGVKGSYAEKFAKDQGIQFVEN
ncbi:MAG: leucine-rich repeat domain-containing protein [Eubacterium sp.]